MKMVKSLLLSGAAGLVAVVGAQAADLPVKAKPVEYVKICSLYGEGFWYIPGTDTCLKIGGWVRAEIAFGAGNSDNAFIAGAAGRNNLLDTSDYRFRTRFVTSWDVRTQTEYGTLRSYIRYGFEANTQDANNGGVLYAVERAFIQFAGFTLGKAQSYFDFGGGVFAYGAAGGFYGGSSSTGAAGTNLFAYTAQFGNGFSATLSLEDTTTRRSAVWDATSTATNALTIGALPGPGVTVAGQGDYAAAQFPDVVGNLRVDQAWGSAQVMGAIHQVRAGYYGVDTGPWDGVINTGTSPGTKLGFAVGAGIILNVPWNQGDKFYVEGGYTQGALAYVNLTDYIGGHATWQRFNGASVAAAWALDGIFGNGIAGLGQTSIQLTTAWQVTAAFEHYWTPALRTDIFGNYTKVDFNGTATALFCSSPQSPIRTLGGAAPAAGGPPLAGCDPDFATWQVGTRTIWNPVKNLDVGVEILYNKIDTKFDPALTTLNFAGAGGRPGGNYSPSSEGVWSGILRFQRNFWP